MKILKTFRDAGFPSGFVWGRTVGSFNVLAVIVCVFRENIHYRLRSPLTIRGGPKGEAAGRRRRTVEVLPGPDPWNKQRTGLAGWPLRQRPIGCGRKSCPEVHFRGSPGEGR
jgi:hypothetical protein